MVNRFLTTELYHLLYWLVKMLICMQWNALLGRNEMEIQKVNG